MTNLSPITKSSHLVEVTVVFCAGALDVTEGVGAAFGIPHVPELWEEVNRGHRSRSSSYRARSRTRSVRSTIAEVGLGHEEASYRPVVVSV